MERLSVRKQRPASLFIVAVGAMSKSREHRRSYRNLHECMSDLLSREDLRRINQLGLWSLFTSVDQIKHFAAQPRSEKQLFYDRFEKGMEDGQATSSPSTDPDYQLFDLPCGATVEQIHRRYRELALSFHPDRREGDHALMQEINAAYRRLLERTQDAG